MKVIYDFGANRGGNLGYYLKKADLVVAVEANLDLCTRLRHRFESFILNKSLCVEHALLSGTVNASVPFFIHSVHDHLSQLDRPAPDELDLFVETRLATVKPSSIIEKYGSPYYVKIDLENSDSIVSRSILVDGITPDFISVEAHSSDIFSILRCLGGYNAFKIVAGEDVYRGKYGNISIVEKQGSTSCFSFPRTSAGPFGDDDIPGPWIDTDSFARLLGIHGFGWIDIHASFSSVVGKPLRLDELSLMKFAAKAIKSYAIRRTNEFCLHPLAASRKLSARFSGNF